MQNPINVLIIGDGEDYTRLEERARELGMTKFVCFYGPCYEEEKVGLLLSLSSLCVCPGHTGLTAIHAMAYGIPVITHDDLDEHAPEAEIIVPGATGDLYDATDPAALTRSISDWIAAERDPESIRLRCIRTIEDHYTPENQARLISRCLVGDAQNAEP